MIKENILRFIGKSLKRYREKEILPPKPMPFVQQGNMNIDFVVTKNKN